tara:strand:+ start:2676 stop:3635 length:960 start_codon:yes stop_codon:yes gene_type:complete
MNVLFFGGTGFFGKSFLKFLENYSPSDFNLESLTIVGRNTSLLEEEYYSKKLGFNLNFIKTDILNDLTFMKDKNFTHVIHAAADSTNVENLIDFDRSDQIINGTKNILNFIKEEYPAAKVLYISSGAIYGKMPKTLNKFSEDFQYEHSSLEHENIYASSKRMAENLCSEYFNKYGLKVSIARCFAFSGECLPKDVHFAIGNFAKNVIESETIKIRGSGKSIRSYLDQNDLAEWLLTILSKDSFDLSIYNVGSDRAISIKDLAELFSVISGKDIYIKVMNSNILESKDSVYVPDCSKIKLNLGVSEKITLEESIMKMIEI